MRRRSRNGSVLIADVLMSVMIVVMLVPVTVISIALMHDAMQFNMQVQDETALTQLRRILLISYDMETDGTCLYFEYQGRQCRLQQVNENLIIQPGTQIILADIDTCSFVTEGNTVNLSYERNGKTYRAAIAAMP